MAKNTMLKSNTLSSSFQKIFNKAKQHTSLSTDAIRLRVKKRNLVSTLSKSKIPILTTNQTDDAIHDHQRNLINEFKLILRETKNNNRNNNALNDDSIIHTFPLKVNTKQILVSNKTNVEFVTNEYILYNNLLLFSR